MDLPLRCNSLKCRARLTDRAVVTTCSHIFCHPCSISLGLSSSSNGVRVCPACDAQLANPDDAVATQLNPTEDYKTSVLSGLNPTIIMECCSRGIAFYQYQVTQEIMYHEYMAKNLADRYANLNSQMDNVIKDANSEISGLRDRLERMHLEKKALEQKNQELVNAFSEKSKAHQRLTKLYQRAKGTQDAEQIRHAAADDVDHFQCLEEEVVKICHKCTVIAEWAAMAETEIRCDVSQNTGSPSLSSSMANYGRGPPVSSQRQATPHRQPLGEMHRNVTSSQEFGGYGSASGGGVKVGGNMEQQRPQIINRDLSRVIHR
ncbi:hypothetical protein KCU95_g13618, partial [Aureobasidium melanogenum]